MRHTKRALALLLCLTLLLGLLTGCQAPTTEQQTELTTEQQTEPTTEQQTISEAALPFGGLTEDTVAFYRPGADTPELVTKQRLEDEALHCYSKSHHEFFVKVEAENSLLQKIYPYVEYALRNGYESFVVADGGRLERMVYLPYVLFYLFPMDQAEYEAKTEGSIPGTDGEIRCSRVTIQAHEGSAERFAEAFAAAQELVASVPADYDEFETARYLYEYLTDNVEYDYRMENYYDDDWHLLYDTLIRHKTVCTGFADALYYLYNLAGIDCQVVYGTVNDGSEGAEDVAHEWNIATLGEHSYYFDATWDVVQHYTVSDTFFAVSESGMNTRSHHVPSLRQDPPDATQNFGVPDWWNNTPEGAIKSFLLLKEYAAYPQLLPYLLGLYDENTALVRTLSGGFGVYNISYEDFADRMQEYVSAPCLRKQFLTGKYAEDDGLLACNTNLEVDPAYRFVRLVSRTDGSCTAEIISNSGNTYTAVFTLTEQDGRWIVDSFRLQK